MEPNLSPKIKSALFCQASGVTSPYEMTIALAENAVANGITLKLMHEVKSIDRVDDHFQINTTSGVLKSKWIINAAGVFADQIAEMVGANTFSIIPRKGEYVLLNKNAGQTCEQSYFPSSNRCGQGHTRH